MPKKTNNSQVITKGDIQRLKVNIDGFAQSTKKDLKGLERKLEKSFKNELENKLEDTELALMIRIEDRAQKTEETLTNLIKETKDDLFSKIDSFMGKVKTLEDENVVGAKQTRRLRVEVDDHEERITKLESPAQSA